MSRLNKVIGASVLAIGALGAAHAAEDLRIGLVLPLSGPFASVGKAMHNGARLYLKENGDEVAGRKVKLFVRDDTGIAPEVSRRVAQELLVQEDVEILAGFGMTPSAFSVAPLATSAKIPMVVMNAGTSSVTERSPYIVRTSNTTPQISSAIATWALANGIKKVYTVVADYGPGHDSEKQFIKTFTEGGGEVVNQVRTPVNNPDFAPFLQRVKDTKPDAVYLFVPAGEQGISFVKGYRERGLDKDGIQLIATGDIVAEDQIGAMGESALGLITSFHYSEAHDSDENKAFVEAYKEAYPGQRPNFLSAGAYDGMRLIFETLKETGGVTDVDKFIAVAKNMAWESPRGPVSIDPETRDIVQNVYIRKVDQVDGLLQNVEFDVIEQIKDPGKEG